MLWLLTEVNMNDGVAKRIVVLKNLSSNIIEEAILILKCDPVQKTGSDGKVKEQKKTAADNNFLLKEANMVINDYIKQNALQSVHKKEYKKDSLIKNKKFMTNTIINIALISSIALFIFMLSRLF